MFEGIYGELKPHTGGAFDNLPILGNSLYRERCLMNPADSSLARQMNSKVIAEEDLARLQRIEAAARELLVASANDGDDFIKSSYEIAREDLRAALEK